MHKRYVVLGLFFALLSLGFSGVAAAQDETVISITVSEILQETFRAAADQFEGTHPGVRVDLVPIPGFGSPVSYNGDIEQYLDDLLEFTQSADVVLVDSSIALASRAGYLLNLAPLMDSDPAFNEADFYATMLHSFRWDGGQWAIPMNGNVSLIYYNPDKFDEAGVAYPDSTWDIGVFESIARQLTEYDEEGNTVQPGFAQFGLSVGELFLSALNTNFYDETTLEIEPDFSDPRLEELMDRWVAMSADGVFDSPTGAINFAELPMFGGSIVIGGEDEQRVTLPPGGHAVVSATGYGISAGSDNPELAYELIKFMSNQPNVVNSFFGGKPARIEVTGEQVESSGEFSFEFAPGSPEVDAMILQGIETGFSASEALFSDGINEALQLMLRDGLDARSALNEIESLYRDLLDAAEARQGTQLTVQHEDGPTLAAGEIQLNFGIGSNISPAPDIDKWQAAAEEFAANAPEVGYVEITSEFPRSVEGMAEAYDCFYLPSNGVADADLSSIRNLDPLLSTDPDGLLDDIIPGVLPLVQVNGQTWAFPMTLAPQVMRFNYDLFSQAGALTPDQGWTVSEFEDALRSIKRILTDEDATPLELQIFDSSVLFTLMAAYGGLPIDYRTDPPTVDFTSPQAIDAIKQVLDLAKEGLIQYDGLVIRGGNFSAEFNGDEEDPVALYTETLNGFGIGLGGGVFIIQDDSGGDTAPIPENTDGYALFPRGTQYSVLPMGVGVAYISASTDHVEPCYRFLREVSASPDLFAGMPARQSVLNDPALETAQGADKVAIYQQIADSINDPDMQLLPSSSGGQEFLTQLWLNRALDRYVFDDADLEAELAEAEAFTGEFLTCTADLPPTEGPGQLRAQFEDIRQCAIDVDPTAEEFFP